jgi:hypothetical protein
MKILVCGGRDFDDIVKLAETLDELRKSIDIDLIIEGGAQGADLMAANWAINRGIHVAEVKALWNAYNKQAGHFRNYAMLLLEPDIVVAFPGGSGTAHMVATAKRNNLDVRLIS